MKIKKIKNNSNKWFDLNPGVRVYTDDGIKTCTRFWFNGFEKTYNIIMSDGYSARFTNNHRLKVDGEWKYINDIIPGDTLNNGEKVVSKEFFAILPTMDTEVPDVHYYVLSNGVHSHNSAFILGQVSEGIEPHKSNYMTKDLAKGKFSIKNQELIKLLKSKDKNSPEVWESILKNNGSVQQLEFLSENEKNVFKTFQEISPKEIIIQASARQKYIDQGQSLNLMIHPKTPTKDINSLILEGWRLGVKAFYYQISINAAQEFSKNTLNCANCES